ncbi:MAG TPA: M48 family metalloprotease [Thermoplasmata archaeon]
MSPAFVGLLYLPVVACAAVAIGLWVTFRRSASPVVLRLAAGFLALWALLATTALLWVVTNGGWTALVRLASSPLELFQPRFALTWLEGGAGAFLVFLIAFVLNQAVGRGMLLLLRPSPFPWPASVPRPHDPVDLLLFRGERAEAFSFTLLALDPKVRGRPVRREVILLSSGLVRHFRPEEREAVIAHELSHILDLDGRYLTFVRTLARMMRWDPVLVYLAATLTRREEFRADARAVRLTGRPLALARALFKSSLWTPPRRSVGVAGLLGGGGERARADVLERIRRLLELHESGVFPEERRGPD